MDLAWHLLQLLKDRAAPQQFGLDEVRGAARRERTSF
jgi:hypothetical protein